MSTYNLSIKHAKLKLITNQTPLMANGLFVPHKKVLNLNLESKCLLRAYEGSFEMSLPLPVKQNILSTHRMGEVGNPC